VDIEFSSNWGGLWRARGAWAYEGGLGLRACGIQGQSAWWASGEMHLKLKAFVHFYTKEGTKVNIFNVLSGFCCASVYMCFLWLLRSVVRQSLFLVNGAVVRSTHPMPRSSSGSQSIKTVSYNVKFYSLFSAIEKSTLKQLQTWK